MARASDDADAIDIGALLHVALDRQPSSDLSERVVDRVAAVATVTEFMRLLTAAPFSWLATELGPEPEPEPLPDPLPDPPSSTRGAR